MNYRPLLGMPFRPSSSMGYTGSRPVISIRGKKVRCLCVFYLFTVLCEKVKQQAEDGFQFIDQCHSFWHVRWFGSSFFDHRACSRLLQE